MQDTRYRCLLKYMFKCEGKKQRKKLKKEKKITQKKKERNQIIVIFANLRLNESYTYIYIYYDDIYTTKKLYYIILRIVYLCHLYCVNE